MRGRLAEFCPRFRWSGFTESGPAAHKMQQTERHHPWLKVEPNGGPLNKLTALNGCVEQFQAGDMTYPKRRWLVYRLSPYRPHRTSRSIEPCVAGRFSVCWRVLESTVRSLVHRARSLVLLVSSLRISSRSRSIHPEGHRCGPSMPHRLQTSVDSLDSIYPR